MFEVPARRVAAELSQYRGGTAHFLDLPGNNGDQLLTLASLQACRAAEVDVSGSIDACDLIVVRGNGAMTRTYGDAVETVMSAAARHKGPMIVLPSTWDLPRNELARLTERKAPTLLFARERPSMDALMRCPRAEEVRLELDHDVALSLDIQPLNIRSGAEHDLVALRTDAEEVPPPMLVALLRRAYVKSVPTTLRKEFKPALSRAYAYMQSIRVPTTDNSFGAGPPLPTVRTDVSDDAIHDFGTFLRLIGGARHVTTSRLHVGILAARMGKPTLLHPGNSYKIPAIYDYSLKDMEHVRLAQSKHSDGESAYE